MGPALVLGAIGFVAGSSLALVLASFWLLAWSMPLSRAGDEAVAGLGLTALLRRVAGIALVVGATLTLASAGVLLIDTLFVLPGAVVQVIVGWKTYRRWSLWSWVGVGCAFWGVWLGLLMTTGIVGPIAWGAVVVNVLAVATSVAVAVLTSRNCGSDVV